MNLLSELNTLYLCLDYCIVDGKFIVDWLAEKMDLDIDIPVELYDIPFVKNHDSLAIKSIIESARGIRIIKNDFEQVISLIHYLYFSRRIDVDTTLTFLYRSMIDNRYSFVESDAEMKIHYFSDGYCLASEGTYGNIEDIVCEFDEWFDRYIAKLKDDIKRLFCHYPTDEKNCT